MKVSANDAFLLMLAIGLSLIVLTAIWGWHQGSQSEPLDVDRMMSNSQPKVQHEIRYLDGWECIIIRGHDTFCEKLTNR